jgi:hypothetical protein
MALQIMKNVKAIHGLSCNSFAIYDELKQKDGNHKEFIVQ